MIKDDPNIKIVERVADALGGLMDELILVGGCAVGLLVTDRAAIEIRATIDVDLLTEVTPLPKYYELTERLREAGFRESEPICRWKKDNLVIDVMPTDEGVLGFTNEWYAVAAGQIMFTELPSGRMVRHIDAPLFIATKLASFHGRGNGDYLHHDMEDIVNVVNGRPELGGEVLAGNMDVRDYIREEIDDLLADEVFLERLRWHLERGPQRRFEIVIERLRNIAGL